MKKKFKWEQWVDPLQPDDFQLREDQSEDDNSLFKALPTPFGMLSITNHSLASNKFHFWILHTNFPITHGLAYELKQVPGVETMNVLTRYRMRFGFPRSGLFNIPEIKGELEDVALGYLRRDQDEELACFDQITLSKAMQVRDHLDDKNDHWALYVLPNGHMEVLIENSPMPDGQFEKKLELLKNVQYLVGGRIITSENEE